MFGIQKFHKYLYGREFILIADHQPLTTILGPIEELRKLFAAYGLPEQMVSDNGPQFVSDEFERFTKENGIKHVKCAPYHPASNGAVERFNQTF